MQKKTELPTKYNSLGKALLNCRKQKKKSRKEVAEDLLITVNRLTNIENGKTIPNPLELEDLIEYYNLDELANIIEEYNYTMGDYIKAYRLRANIELEELSKLLCLSERTLYRIENGNRLPKPNEISSIKVILDIPNVRWEKVLTRTGNANGCDVNYNKAYMHIIKTLKIEEITDCFGVNQEVLKGYFPLELLDKLNEIIEIQVQIKDLII